MAARIRLVITSIATEYKIVNLTDVATSFSRDVATFSRGLNRLQTSGNVGFDEIRRYVGSAIVQA